MSGQRESPIYLQGDIQSRMFLLRLANDAYRAGGLEACARLLRCEFYLADRKSYAAVPPPAGDYFPMTAAERCSVRGMMQ